MRKDLITLTGLTSLLVPLVAFGAIGMASTAQAAEAFCDGRPATIVVMAVPGSDKTNPLVGTPGNDVIVGTPLQDTIDGAAGDDVICGLDNADQLTGGPGNDRLFGGLDMDYKYPNVYRGDLLVPGPGDDYVDLGFDPDSDTRCYCDAPLTVDRVSYADATSGVRVNMSAGNATGAGRDTIVGDGALGLIGSPYDDRLFGTDKEDYIAAGAGADTVETGDGADWISLDAATFAEPVSARGSRDTLNAGDDNDHIVFSGGDRIGGGPGDDRVSGRSDALGSVQGDVGRDEIDVTGPIAVDGGVGRDTIDASFTRRGRYLHAGGEDRDNVTLTIEPTVPARRITVDMTRGRTGRMSLAGSRSSVLLAGIESLHIVRAGRKKSGLTFLGSNRTDVFSVQGAYIPLRAYGRGGSDLLYGGEGNDYLDGGPGSDWLVGYEGRDRCLKPDRSQYCEVRR